MKADPTKGPCDTAYSAGLAGPGPSSNLGAPRRKRHRIGRAAGIVLLVLVLVLGVGRALLPRAVRDYVNRTLDLNPLYEGNIGKVRIHLMRGSYSIDAVALDFDADPYSQIE